MTRLKYNQNIMPEDNIILREVYYDSVFLFLDTVKYVKNYKDYMYETILKNKLAAYTLTFLNQQAAIANQGLIPDIELPIRLPRAIAGIIGQGGNLRISGSQRIEFGGSQSTDLNSVQTEYSQSNFLPELKMEQRLNVNLQGTIGEKINVFVDHNSEAESSLKNKIRLQYQGENDEVVHLIEMGHTQLSLPGTNLIGMPPVQMGLFGIKTELQFAALNIIAIASKEEGKADHRTFVGQATVDTVQVWDVNYIRRQYYNLGNQGDSIGDINQGDSILKLIVWVDDNNGNNNSQTGAIRGNLHFYTSSSYQDTVLPQGYFDPQDAGNDNYYLYDYTNNILELRTPLDENYALATCYIIKRADQSIDTVGTYQETYDTTQTIELKVLKPQAEKTYYPTWELQIRNRYSIQSTAVVPGSFELKIYKQNTGAGDDEETQGGETYLHLLGLDDDNNGFIDPGFVDYDRGYVKFPDTLLFPFESPVLLDPDSVIYDTTSTNVGKKYKLIISYKGIRSVFSLGAMNILEGSEVVTVNGERLTRNVDYTIDYDIGLITFITDKINDPNAVVNIDFQYAPFISLADKSLLGVRMDYMINPSLNLGATAMFRSIGTKDDHPQLGNESRNILMATADANFTFHPGFMTKAVDLLPFISTTTPSLLTIQGAIATSIPNPNTMGFVYFDDMEANTMNFSLGVNRMNWHFGNVPDNLSSPGTYQDTSLLGQIYWYSPNDWFRKEHLNPNLPENERNDNIQVLSVVVDPVNNDPSSFVSLEQCFSKTGMNLTEFRFLEVWVYGDNGNVYVDLGYNIPEDIARRTAVNDSIAGWNGILNTEDRNHNGILDIGEDYGLDNTEGIDANHVSGDEWNDDYPSNVSSSTYRQLKGTEKNDRLDTEDLNGDGILNVSKDFVEYSFQPGDTQFLSIDRGNGWRLYKIPLHDSSTSTTVGSPDWERVRYARIWIDGFTQTDSLLFANISLVGNRWRRNNVYSLDSTADSLPDEYFEVTTKSNYTDPDYYPPFDPGRDDYGNQKKEQSLVMIVDDLGFHRVASCYYATSIYDNYNKYKKIKFYVHGTGQDGYLSFRMGGDTLSYYEYRLDIPNGWQEYTIDFQKFIDLKKTIEGDTTGLWSDGEYFVQTYGLSKPSLTKVNRLTLSLVNTNQTTPLEGEVWIDEMRLVTPYAERGIAANLAVGMSFGDVLSLNTSVSYRDADYMTITQEQGGGSNTITYSGSGIFQGGKLFPQRWGISIPVSGYYTSSNNLPKFYPGSDIRLNASEAEEQSTKSNTRTITTSFVKTIPSLNRILSLTVDHTRLSATYSNTNTITYNRADSTWTKSANIAWSYSPVIPTLKIFGQEIGTFLNNMSVTSIYSYTKVASHLRPDTSATLLANQITQSLTNTYIVGYNLLKPLSTTYSFTRNRNLELDKESLFGREITRTQNVSIRYSPLPFQFLRPTFTYSTSYAEDSRPELRQTIDSTDIRNVGNITTMSVSTNLSFSQPFAFIGSIRDENQDSAATIGSPHWLLMNFSKIGKIISPLNFTFTQTKTTRFYRLIYRPNLRYQLGLIDNINEDEVGKYISPNDYRSTSDNISANSGLNLPNFSMGVNFVWAKSTGGNIGNQTVSETSTWPRFTFALSNLQKFIKISAMQSSTVTSSISTTQTSSGPVDEDPTRKTKSFDLSPLISFQVRWKNGLNTNFNHSRTRSDIDNLGVITTLTRQENSTYSATLGYTFSAPGGLPLFGIHFNSLMTLSLSYRYNTVREFYRTSGEDISYRSSYAITPTASYNFSQNITGGLNSSFTMNEDRQTGRKIRNVALSVWAEFKF